MSCVSRAEGGWCILYAECSERRGCVLCLGRMDRLLLMGAEEFESDLHLDFLLVVMFLREDDLSLSDEDM